MRRLLLPLGLALAFACLSALLRGAPAPASPPAPGEVDLDALRRDIRGVRPDPAKVREAAENARRNAFGEKR